jgi:hypothetical protein
MTRHNGSDKAGHEHRAPEDQATRVRLNRIFARDVKD